MSKSTVVKETKVIQADKIPALVEHVNFYKKYGSDIYSQNGEDGVLAEVFKRLGIDKGRFCEFGAADGKFCSNTRLLLEKGWSGKYIEPNPGHSKGLIDNTMGMSVELHFGFVTAQNANELIFADINLLSSDTDNDDYHIWKNYSGQPDVVVIEVNSSFAPPQVVIPGQAGASYQAVVELGIEKGYFLLAHRGNCIFILNKHRELFPEIVGDGLSNSELYFDRSWL